MLSWKQSLLCFAYSTFLCCCAAGMEVRVVETGGIYQLSRCAVVGSAWVAGRAVVYSWYFLPILRKESVCQCLELS